MVCFTFSFGVAVVATMFPKMNYSSDPSAILKLIIDLAYWPIFGSTDYLKVFAEGFCFGNNVCPDIAGQRFSYLFFILYMIVMNVMLLNILIAAFG